MDQEFRRLLVRRQVRIWPFTLPVCDPLIEVTHADYASFKFLPLFLCLG